MHWFNSCDIVTFSKIWKNKNITDSNHNIISLFNFIRKYFIILNDKFRLLILFMSNITNTNNTKKKISGSFALLDSLVRNGTKYIFGYPGGAILPIYDELYRWEEKNLIKHILVRHEQGAAHAADAYARATGFVDLRICSNCCPAVHFAHGRL